MNNVEKLFIGDPRGEVIVQAIVDLLHERADGMPIPMILGLLDIAKQQILEDALND